MSFNQQICPIDITQTGNSFAFFDLLIVLFIIVLVFRKLCVVVYFNDLTNCIDLYSLTFFGDVIK